MPTSALSTWASAPSIARIRRSSPNARSPWRLDLGRSAGRACAGAAVRDALRPQDCLYTLIENDGTDERASVVGVLREALFAPEEGDTLLARIAAPSTRIVTLTVTEKGYGHNPATGDLDLRPSRYPGRPCGRGPAALDPRLARARAHAAAGRACRRAHRALLRQHGEQRPHAARPRPAVRRAGRPRSRRLDRGSGPLPEQHGRPDRPGGDAGLARPCGRACWACATRRR